MLSCDPSETPHPFAPAEFARRSSESGKVAYANGSSGRFSHLVPTADQFAELRFHAHAYKRGVERQFVELADALKDGYTLYFKNVGRRLLAIGEVVEQVRVATSARYWEAAVVRSESSDPGFDAHQDVAELVVLQLAGAKRWTVYDDDGQVTFSGNLSSGDMLYVPLDWLHYCEPLGSSTHVTVSFRS